MTLRDMFDAGIVIDGNYTILAYDHETDRYLEYDRYSEKALDSEIKFIYASDHRDLTIEVECLSEKC